MSTTVSVVLGSFNRHRFLRATLESIRENGMDFPYEIIVVDGGSTDGSLQYLQQQKDVISVVQHNRGAFRGREITRRSWGYFMNLGFKIAQGKYVLMISDDCLLVPGAAANGVALFEDLLAQGERTGAMAFYWRNWPEQQDYWVGLTLGDKMFVNHGLYLRSALEEVGWIDEETYQFYYGDGDLCLKLWDQGFSVVDCQTAFVEHCDHAKPSRSSSAEDRAAYLRKWEGAFYDPKIDNRGGWLYLPYTDPYQTYRRFPVRERLRIKAIKPVVERCRRLSRSLKQKVGSRVKRLTGI